MHHRTCTAVKVSTLLVCTALALAAQQLPSAPSLLVNAQRLKRMGRDRERNTPRWQNFADRVQNVADSPERGFELALYSLVARDPARGKEAITWALAHKCERRQVDLVLDWIGDAVSSEDRRSLEHPACTAAAADSGFSTLRDHWFDWAAVTENQHPDLPEDLAADVRAQIPHGESLMALAEYMLAVRMLARKDLRESDPRFFLDFPKRILLSLQPDQLVHPDWHEHIAALILVALDPNLESSQFLQGWALEEAQTLREGPGVGYEFLWADPYLPGVAYQNMDPWLYDKGELLARDNWEPGACWLSIHSRDETAIHCPEQLHSMQAHFGSLTLLPAASECTELPQRNARETQMLWRLEPMQPVKLSRQGNSKESSDTADSAGLLRVPVDVSGKVCRAKLATHGRTS